MSPLDAMSDEDLVPSFFECIAEQYFVDALQPALSYLFAILAPRSRLAAWALRHDSEIFFAGLVGVNWHFLRSYNATFSENFYSLQRVSAVGKPLTTRQQLASLAMTVGVPYIRARLEDWYEPYASQPLAVQGEQRSPARLRLDAEGPAWKKLAVRTYPWLCGAIEGSTFIFQLLYLHGRTRFFSLWLRMLNLRLLRLSPDDVESHERVSVMSREKVTARLSSSIVGRLLARMLFGGMDIAQYVLPISVFVYRFAEWWNSDENEALRGPKEVVRIPPPPKSPPIAVMELPQDPRKCPVCKEMRKIEMFFFGCFFLIFYARCECGDESVGFRVLLRMFICACARPRCRPSVWRKVHRRSDHKTVLIYFCFFVLFFCPFFSLQKTPAMLYLTTVLTLGLCFLPPFFFFFFFFLSSSLSPPCFGSLNPSSTFPGISAVSISPKIPCGLLPFSQ